MEIPSDQAPGISSWRQGASCGGNCVEERWITEPMESRVRGPTVLAERFRHVAQALTDPPIPRTFCPRFALLELARPGRHIGQSKDWPRTLANSFWRAMLSLGLVSLSVDGLEEEWRRALPTFQGLRAFHATIPLRGRRRRSE